MSILEALKALGPSIIRTASPMLVGLVVTALASAGLDWQPSELAGALATILVSMAWYALVRALEEFSSTRWGWLLGLPSAPRYGDVVESTVVVSEVDPTSPTGESAGEASGLPEGTPTETVPAEAEVSPVTSEGYVGEDDDSLRA